MPIHEPLIRAECDVCSATTDDMDLTALAGGGWDDRNIKRRLQREGWLVEGHQTICPDCQEPDAAHASDQSNRN